MWLMTNMWLINLSPCLIRYKVDMPNLVTYLN